MRHALLLGAWTRTPTRTSRRRWTVSAGCWGAEFAATPTGYARLLGWLQGFGTVGLVGIEGTGSYGAGLARHIAAAGIRAGRGGPLGPSGGSRPAGSFPRWLPMAGPVF
jgi:hypothetical protein